MLTDLRGGVTDADLVRSARAGDAASLGTLLDRHRARMYAVALSILGAGPDAEDAVQDAALIAVGRLGDLRDPDAAGAWLRGIVRNACRALRRRDRCVPAELPDSATREPGPEELLDRLALRDWVWRALDELSPPLRLVTMLRYFTRVDDYESIAQACGVPVGTVRSRLSQARTKLTGALRATSDAAGYDDLAAVTGARWRQAIDVFDALAAGDYAPMVDVFHPDVQSFWPSGTHRRDADSVVRVISQDQADGIGHRLSNVVAGRDVIIWENELFNPPWDPWHCPPGVAWVQSLRGGRTDRLRIVHRPRSPEQMRPASH
ncbi:sigma-70 family RNA polymerase sigma factor [Actinoplanes sp. NBRC 103695]|uniref:RNA polymerase sigma factor n=1 Tax=Actinoplanes sp. NBRC 103695 TaxID=3032202 RepID=UPI0024A0DEE9|nr:sigma-70 family RNA polymerase sigma factor [Actinoplanes sp. NBRC 103695]GLY99671.1 DNA-directed RNA polymerase sigma-70 factor [Actinoplanes sp. NBRC 103695]